MIEQLAPILAFAVGAVAMIVCIRISQSSGSQVLAERLIEQHGQSMKLVLEELSRTNRLVKAGDSHAYAEMERLMRSPESSESLAAAAAAAAENLEHEFSSIEQELQQQFTRTTGVL